MPTRKQMEKYYEKKINALINFNLDKSRLLDKAVLLLFFLGMPIDKIVDDYKYDRDEFENLIRRMNDKPVI